MLWALRYIRCLKILVFKMYKFFCLIEALPLIICTILSFPHIFYMIFEFISSKLRPKFTFLDQKIMIEFQHKIIFCSENFWLWSKQPLTLHWTYHSIATGVQNTLLQNWTWGYLISLERLTSDINFDCSYVI